MNLNITTVVMGIAFCVSIFLIMLRLHEKFVNENVLAKNLQKYLHKVEMKKNDELFFSKKFGTIENNSIIYKFDRLVLISGLKKYFHNITAEKYLLLMAISFVASFFITFSISKLFLLTVFISVLIVAIEYLLLLALSNYTYSKIDEQTPMFVSTLGDYSRSSDDIVTVMKNTLPSLEDPMRSLVEEFLKNADREGNVDFAFDVMKESVDNKQLRVILTNLKNCMRYQANYDDLLVEMTGQITTYIRNIKKRKNILFSVKMTIAILSFIGIGILFFIGETNGFNPVTLLLSSPLGKIALFTSGMIFIFIFVKLFAETAK